MPGKRILFLDQDADIRMMAASRLRAAGYDVVAVSNGEEALRQALEAKPDLALLELGTKMEGYETCVQLKSKVETKSIPVLMSTTIARNDWDIKCWCAGAKAVIVKPFHPQELLAMIQKAFDPDSKWRKPEGA